MKKNKLSTQIINIRRKGHKTKGLFADYYSLPGSLFCVSVRKKVLKRAVDRNKVRRWYKNIHSQETFTQDILVIVNKPPKSYREVKQCWEKFTKQQQKH